MLPADEHGFLARIASAAAAAFALRVRFVQFHKAAILRAVELDVIIRRTYARDGRVVVAVLMRDLQIVGIVSALGDVLAPIALRTWALDIAAVRLVLRLHRIAGSDIVRMPVIRLLKIGIRILRLHCPFHKGGKKRRRLPREDAPCLVRTTLVGDVPTSVGCCLFGILFHRCTARYNKGCFTIRILGIGVKNKILGRWCSQIGSRSICVFNKTACNIIVQNLINTSRNSTCSCPSIINSIYLDIASYSSSQSSPLRHSRSIIGMI
ncbi:hypothetical protein HMPREF1153_1351 [Selenomonas sp. CM52]|nr:hypothetical protein HMPREF1153_1351 [Selenomonas sp. CM52]